MRATCDIGIIGLGVMGAALARNFHSRGLRVAGYNYEPAGAASFAEKWGDDRFAITSDYGAFVASLQKPRRIVVMVTAGKAVDSVLSALAPLLENADIVVDGGNSLYTDTERRDAWCRERGFHFVGMGVSGGEEGALRGPAMMPGGDREAWLRLQPVLEPAAAISDSGPCVAWCGKGGAGHFVKTVHNGIEYGDMQLIAEIWLLLRDGLGLTPHEQADVFAAWNRGPLASYLLELTSQIVDVADPAANGTLVSQVLDVAGSKGTGKWTVEAALNLGVPIPTITAAVEARALSAQRPIRLLAHARYPGEPTRLRDVSVDDLAQALFASRLMGWTQGFMLLQAASAAHGFETDLAAVARIWKAGCIIRAAWLDRVWQALRDDPQLPALPLAPGFQAELQAALPAWQKVVARAIDAGIAVPAMAASLTYFQGLRSVHGPAALIQAQRDAFGAHTYRRADAPEVAVHTLWLELPKT
jgi:6-phosphogluconate dehydrogenase